VFSAKKSSNPLAGQTELDIDFSAKKPSHIMNGQTELDVVFSTNKHTFGGQTELDFISAEMNPMLDAEIDFLKQIEKIVADVDNEYKEMK